MFYQILVKFVRITAKQMSQKELCQNKLKIELGINKNLNITMYGNDEIILQIVIIFYNYFQNFVDSCLSNESETLPFGPAKM
jgi:hypothetical protein